jgi:hypothetical protein
MRLNFYCLCDKANVTHCNEPFVTSAYKHILSSSKVHKNILLLSNDQHMNAHNLLENQTYLDLHMMVYKIDKIILAVSLIKCQNNWFLLQPFPCNKNRSYCFHIEHIQYFIYVLWQNYINASIYLYRHWCLVFWFYLSLSLEI